jgi:hypothetical protein
MKKFPGIKYEISYKLYKKIVTDDLPFGIVRLEEN